MPSVTAQYLLNKIILDKIQEVILNAGSSSSLELYQKFHGEKKPDKFHAYEVKNLVVEEEREI